MTIVHLIEALIPPIKNGTPQDWGACIIAWSLILAIIIILPLSRTRGLTQLSSPDTKGMTPHQAMQTKTQNFKTWFKFSSRIIFITTYHCLAPWYIISLTIYFITTNI